MEILLVLAAVAPYLVAAGLVSITVNAVFFGRKNELLSSVAKASNSGTVLSIGAVALVKLIAPAQVLTLSLNLPLTVVIATLGLGLGAYGAITGTGQVLSALNKLL